MRLRKEATADGTLRIPGQGIRQPTWPKLVTSGFVPRWTWEVGPYRVIMPYRSSKPSPRTRERDRIQGWLTKHLIFCFLERMHGENTPMMLFQLLLISKMPVEKATVRAGSELLRATTASHGAKLLVAATGKRAYHNGHLVSNTNAVLRSMGACGAMFDSITFECTLPRTELNCCQPQTWQHRTT